MENKNDVIKENNTNEINHIDKKDCLNNTYNNTIENNTIQNKTNIKIKNRKFIEEIIQYLEKSNDLISKFKDKLDTNMKVF